MPSTICPCCPCFWARSEATPEEVSAPLTPPRTAPLLDPYNIQEGSYGLDSAGLHSAPQVVEIDREGYSTPTRGSNDEVSTDPTVAPKIINTITEITRGLDTLNQQIIGQAQGNGSLESPDSANSANSVDSTGGTMRAQIEDARAKRRILEDVARYEGTDGDV